MAKYEALPIVESKVNTAPILTTAGLDEILLLSPFDRTPHRTSNSKGETQTTSILFEYFYHLHAIRMNSTNAQIKSVFNN